MSILNTSLSGMSANTSWLTTIAQNVANANTTGFKNVDTYFSSLVGAPTSEYPTLDGVTTTSRSLNSLQGTLQTTATSTDLAVEGSGYFVVSNSSGDIYLTRDGSFIPDANGNLVNADGYYLMGSAYGNQAGISSLSALSKVNVPTGGESATASTTASLNANLNSNATAVTGDTPYENAADSQYTSETSLTAYDDLGNAQTINVYYTKTAADSWEVDAYAASGATNGGFPYTTPLLGNTTLNFDPTTGDLTGSGTLDVAVPNGQTVAVDMSKSTQLASDFSVGSSNINGNAPSAVTQIVVSNNGTLSFDYGAGSATPVYTIPLATVTSPDNMDSVVGNAFLANPNSGSPQLGVANTGGLGSINSSSLEESTVDLATELTSMVQAQASYEANSKVFQTGAKLLDVLNNLQT